MFQTMSICVSLVTLKYSGWKNSVLDIVRKQKRPRGVAKEEVVRVFSAVRPRQESFLTQSCPLYHNPFSRALRALVERGGEYTVYLSDKSSGRFWSFISQKEWGSPAASTADMRNAFPNMKVTVENIEIYRWGHRRPPHNGSGRSSSLQFNTSRRWAVCETNRVTEMGDIFLRR